MLPILAAQLNVIFERENVTDFIELNLAALRSLGDAERPTDLALHLDYQINHLLIDEFQDTSVIQFDLIERLLAGWQANDGHSIFLVGDPMQSIYRFRNAEVGLFLRAQQKGISNISLQPLTLYRNFRSSKKIVEWNNQHFSKIFPNSAEITTGATPYSTATTTDAAPSGNIAWHTVINDDGTQEAEQVVTIIRKLQEKHPNDCIAILVRSRSHLQDIIPTLHEEKFDFQAIELESLARTIEIQDAHTLTRAVLHRADKIAWLALLRAPYCGLSLTDLYTLAQSAGKGTLYTILKKYYEKNTLETSNDLLSEEMAKNQSKKSKK